MMMMIKKKYASLESQDVRHTRRVEPGELRKPENYKKNLERVPDAHYLLNYETKSLPTMAHLYNPNRMPKQKAEHKKFN